MKKFMQEPGSDGSYVEDGLPKFVRSPEKATALSCSSCGAAALRGAPMCLHCGSGLNSEIFLDIEKLRNEADELSWERDLGHNESFFNMIEEMLVIAHERKRAVFTIVNSLPPLLVRPDLDFKENKENHYKLRALMERDKLGSLWYGALRQFNELQKKLASFSVEERGQIADVFLKLPVFNYPPKRGEEFFQTLDFADAENMIGYFPRNNDAERLLRLIEVFNEAIASAGLA